MMVVQLNMKRRLLLKTEFLAGFIPKLMAVGLDKRGLDAVHYNTAIICQCRQYLSHNLLEFASMSAYKDGIGKPLLLPLPHREGSR